MSANDVKIIKLLIDMKHILKKIEQNTRIQTQFRLSEPVFLEAGNYGLDGGDCSWKHCNCGDHKTGEQTWGWYCPVHGDCK